MRGCQIQPSAGKKHHVTFIVSAGNSARLYIMYMILENKIAKSVAYSNNRATLNFKIIYSKVHVVVTNAFHLLLCVQLIGPCPPCPKTVRVSCHCGSHPPVVRRCSAKSWSCGKPCGKLLSCDHHNCESPCHSGKKELG